MADMICPLFDIPSCGELLQRLHDEGIHIRHAQSWERTALYEFIEQHFSRRWADEVSLGFHHQPISIIVAVKGEEIIGFAAYEVTAPAYFGPTGVNEAYRGHGIGKALLLEALAGLRNLGYVYGIIGSPGPIDFYRKFTNGIMLPEEWTTIYSNTLSLTTR